MSTYYYVYTEAKIHGRWVGIDPMLPKYENDGAKELRYHETYWNGSRSCFSEAYSKLEQIGVRGKFIECSEEVKQQFKHSLENEQSEDESLGGGYYPVFVDWNIFNKYIDLNKYDSHGLIHKDSLFAYQNGDIYELYPVEHEDIEGLTTEELQAYTYYEWDDGMGWNGHFKDIYRKVQSRINDFKDINYLYEDIEVRLVIVACW